MLEASRSLVLIQEFITWQKCKNTSIQIGWMNFEHGRFDEKELVVNLKTNELVTFVVICPGSRSISLKVMSLATWFATVGQDITKNLYRSIPFL